MGELQWAVNKMPKTDDKNLPVMALSEVEKARHLLDDDDDDDLQD